MSEELLLLEPIGGIAGDMFLAAALDLGVSAGELESILQTLKLPEWTFEVTKQERHGISGTHLNIEVSDKTEHQHRRYKDIDSLIQNSQMPSRAKENALKVFLNLGEVEAQIHNVPLDQIHFHEVGAVDSIVDICGAAVVIELLGNPKVLSLPPPLGSGTAKIAHGVVPVPVPATLALLKNIPVLFEGTGELTTPTGAALLKTLATVGPFPGVLISKIGYGLGTRNPKDRANLLRMSVAKSSVSSSSLCVLECNLDDCSPQIIGSVLEQLLLLGALDVWVLPALMKKNRPGHLLGILCSQESKERLLSVIFSETTTLGIREMLVTREELQRRLDTVKTPWGEVRIKIGLRAGTIVNVAPEFEDCRAIQKSHQVAIKTIQQTAVEIWRQQK